LIEQESGKIVNISSSTAYWGTPSFHHYVASKAALIRMTRSFACASTPSPRVEHEGQETPKELTVLQLKARSIKRLGPRKKDEAKRASRPKR
jgi:short chain dehydrogenase